MTSIQRRHAIVHHIQLRKRVGLRKRMLAWFEANPHDDLTIEQLALKFDAKVSTVYSEISRLKAEGAIESVTVLRLKVE